MSQQGSEFCLQNTLRCAGSHNFLNNQVQLRRSSLSMFMLAPHCQAFTWVPAFAAQHPTAIVSPWEASPHQPTQATESLDISGTTVPPTDSNRFSLGSH